VGKDTRERKKLVPKLIERIVALEAGYQHLQEQAQRNSQNSSRPPSQDQPTELVDGSHDGEHLCALAGCLSGEYRQSHRRLVRLPAEVVEIDLSVGSVGQLR